MALIVILHMLSAVIWVGGMFFAYLALRPAADAVLEPQQKLRLWTMVFARFFAWVWLAIVVLLVTGVWAVFGKFGGMANAGAPIHVMMGLGGIMILIFLHVYFAPFRRLKQAVAASDWELAAGKATQIRMLIVINLVLGLIVVCVAAASGYH